MFAKLKGINIYKHNMFCGEKIGNSGDHIYFCFQGVNYDCWQNNFHYSDWFNVNEIGCGPGSLTGDERAFQVGIWECEEDV
jgi:hypothetical protein